MLAHGDTWRHHLGHITQPQQCPLFKHTTEKADLYYKIWLISIHLQCVDGTLINLMSELLWLFTFHLMEMEMLESS